MYISVKDLGEKECVCDALILPVTEGGTKQYDYLGRPAGEAFRKAFAKKFSGKKNEVFLVPAPDGFKAEWILLAGLGKKEGVTAEGLRQAGGRSAGYLRDNGMKMVALSSKLISSFKLSPSFFAEGALLSLYAYCRYKKEENGKKNNKIIRAIFMIYSFRRGAHGRMVKLKPLTSGKKVKTPYHVI